MRVGYLGAGAGEEAAGVLGGDLGDVFDGEVFEPRDRFAGNPNVLRLVPGRWVRAENRRVRLQEESIDRQVPS